MNLLNKIDAMHGSLTDLSAYIMGYGGARPYRNPYNLVSYRLWFIGLTQEEKEAECELLRKGFYAHEGVSNMFGCNDIEEKEIHIDDVCKVTENIGGLEEGTEVIVMTVLSESEVQVNPINVGLPEIVQPAMLKVIYSFIEKLTALRSDEELQAILKQAEDRFYEELPQKKEKKEKKTVAKVPQEELDF